MTTPKARSVAQKLAKKKEILKAAHELIEEEICELPTVIQVARKAGVGKGTIYLYFHSKEQLYSEVLLEHWKNVVACFNRIEPTKILSGKQIIDFRPVINYWFENPGFVRLMSLKSGVILPSLSSEDRTAYLEQANELVVKKAKTISASSVTQTDGLNLWSELIDLSLHLIHLSWQKASGYETKIPDKLLVTELIEQCLKPHWDIQISRLDKKVKTKKPWRSLLWSANK